jgi:diguanylate cyclase (GGDEF)-like protein/putative nucleotidyltransferase with HDIG domain
LTGLYNRRFMDEEIKRLNTSRNLPISIIMGDLNQLKLINDAFGRETGDKLIRTVAGVIQRGCRSEDLAARWDGDLFIIFLPKTKTAETEIIVQRIQSLIDQEHVNNLHIKVSFGVATQASLDQGISETIRLAEDAMLARKNQENASSRGDILKAITSTFFSRNPEEKKHADIVSSLCHKTAQALGLNTADVNKIALGGLMHDIGKIAVPSETLDKPGTLNHEEWQAIRTHPEIGYKIMASIPDMIEVGKAILAHHERYDGDGYPSGVKLDDISLYARIITLADSYATMTTNQVYKPGLSRSAAIEEIRRNEGSQFDPDIAEIFINEVILRQSDT